MRAAFEALHTNQLQDCFTDGDNFYVVIKDRHIREFYLGGIHAHAITRDCGTSEILKFLFLHLQGITWTNL